MSSNSRTHSSPGNNNTNKTLDMILFAKLSIVAMVQKAQNLKRVRNDVFQSSHEASLFI